MEYPHLAAMARDYLAITGKKSLLCQTICKIIKC